MALAQFTFAVNLLCDKSRRNADGECADFSKASSKCSLPDTTKVVRSLDFVCLFSDHIADEWLPAFK